MNFGRNALGMLATRIVGIPLALIASIVLTRWLTEADRGTFAVATSFVAMVVSLVQLGWPSATIYRIRRMGSPPAEVVGAGLIAVAVINAFTVLATLLFADPIRARLLDGASPGVLALAIAMVPIQMLARVLSGVARAIDQFAVANWADIWGRVFNAAGLFAALVLFGGGLHAALWVTLITGGGIVLARVVPIVRQTGVRFRGDPAELREGARYGLKTWLTSLAGELHERVDILLLAALLPEQASVAHYAVAAGLSQYLKLIPESLGLALFPKLSGLAPRESGEFAARVCRMVTAWVALSVIGMALAGPLVIPLLYGDRYAPAILPYLVLLPGVAALTIYRILGRYFASENRQEVTTVIQTVSILLNVALNFALIPPMGILGAALASVASYTLEAVLIIVIFQRATGIGLAGVLIPRKGEATEALRRLRSRR